MKNDSTVFSSTTSTTILTSITDCFWQQVRRQLLRRQLKLRFQNFDFTSREFSIDGLTAIDLLLRCCPLPRVPSKMFNSIQFYFAINFSDANAVLDNWLLTASPTTTSSTITSTSTSTSRVSSIDGLTAIDLLLRRCPLPRVPSTTFNSQGSLLTTTGRRSTYYCERGPTTVRSPFRYYGRRSPIPTTRRGRRFLPIAKFYRRENLFAS